jgi:hypothetical protein
MNIFDWWTELARLKPAPCLTMLHERWSRMPSNMPAWYLLLFTTCRCWSSKWSPRKRMGSTWPRIRRPGAGCVAGGHSRTSGTSWSGTCWVRHLCTATTHTNMCARPREWYDTHNLIPQVLHNKLIYNVRFFVIEGKYWSRSPLLWCLTACTSRQCRSGREAGKY